MSRYSATEREPDARAWIRLEGEILDIDIYQTCRVGYS